MDDEGCRGFELRANGHKVFADESAKEHPPRDRTFKLKHIRLELSIDEKERTVAGTATLTLAPINDGLREVELDADDLVISRVTDGSKPLEFEYIGNRLQVRLGRPAKADQDIEIRVAYSAKPKRGMFFIQPTKAYPKHPWMVWTQGEQEYNRAWFPSYDSPNEKMTSEVIVTLNERFFAVSNGRLAKQSQDARQHTRTFHWIQDVPHVNYLITIVAGEFDVVEEPWDGVPLQYYVPKGMRDAIQETFKHVPSMMTFFSEVTGLKYPYAKYAETVVKDFVIGGMENTSLTVLTEYSLIRDDRIRPDYEPEGLLAHELAHQWFGDWITTKSWGHLWLNEGFASYFDPLWHESAFGKDEFHFIMQRVSERYFEEDSESYRRPIVVHKFNELEDMLDAHTYNKGAWALHMMRFVLGDDLWWKSMRQWVKKHAAGTAETNDLKVAIEEATGRNLDWFFDEWLYKGGHPEFEVSWSYDEKAKLVALQVKQKQEVKDVTPLFRMPVEVEVATDRKTRRDRIQVERAEQTFFLESPTKPKMVVFDPENWILKTLKFEKPKEELIHQLANAANVIPKIQACQGLGKILNDESVVQSLSKALRGDKHHSVRLAAARALGDIRTPGAREALLGGLKDGDSRVRRGVYEALGQFHRSDEALDVLAKAFREERQYYGIGAAASAIAGTKHDRGFEILAKELEKPRASPHEIVTRQVLAAIGTTRDARAIPILKKYTAEGQHELVRAAACTALGHLGDDLEEKKDEIREILVPLLRDENYRARLGAISGLGTMADGKATDELAKVQDSDPLGIPRSNARAAIRKIREKRAERSKKMEQQEELDKLKDENKDLKGRVAKLEGEVEKLLKRKR